MDGGMGLHSYIAQVDLERKHVIHELNRAKTQVPRISIQHAVDPVEHPRVSVSAELRKPGQGFAWGQQWSPSVGPAQGVGSGRDIIKSRGCDASILLDGNNNEKKAVPNSSVRGYGLIDAIKEALEAECQGLVSCADTISMATRDALVLLRKLKILKTCVSRAGGKWYDVETGRRDGEVSLASNVKLPAATISVSDSIKPFASKSLTQTDMVYLLVARCSLFKDRIYNFNKTGGPDPSMSPWLLAELKDKCPRISLIFDNTYPLDVKTPSLVDNSYFQEIKKGNGVLQIDQQIALDELTKNIVDDIVNDPDFYTKFGEAMVKLGRVEVLIDGQGEVRKSCRVVNKKPFIFGGLN
ncbi:hypothetical protein KY290_019124 [Solanum tuberosum]|uniref:Peroxidase n=1 Tax=Solanum tuberosum TaxID=4113 RepID=A0ABQ7VGF1_SOLTU|nr:hypothetical protein KY290_019124 [Solanum tuberosum]